MIDSLRNSLVAIIVLWALIWSSYGISLRADWHVDDIPNIVRNQKIHLSRLDANSVVDTFFAGREGNLYRPVPMASFALNWYLDGPDALGYRLVNILIHCINAALLYLVIKQLLQAPRFAGVYARSQVHWIAFLSAALWACNPIHIQAVTYIVQRMASMAALFFLSGTYFYIRYRGAATRKGRTGALACTIGCYLMAVLSKENAVLFPFSIGLITIVFYTPNQRLTVPKQWRAAVAVSLLTLSVGLLFFFVARGNPLQLIEGLYAERPFTIASRVLTEFRILIFYLSQLFLPLPSRLSFCHDIVVSTSIIKPWTTLPAALLIGAAIVLSLIGYRKKPLLSFSCLFFFLNHGVESTILPLELVFEHRNYLPSLFIFLPLAHALVCINDHAFSDSRSGRVLAVGMACLTIGLFCNWTFSRNMVWLSAKTLWEDEIHKNPNLARPYHNLAWGHYQARGQYHDALALYEKALSLKTNTPFDTASTLNNMGRVYYLMGSYEKALQTFERSIAAYPPQKITEYQLIMALLQLNRWKEAIQRIDRSLGGNQPDADYLKLKGIALAKNGENEQSVVCLYDSLNLKNNSIDTRAHLGVGLARLGRVDEALDLVSSDGAANGKDPRLILALSEIHRIDGNDINLQAVFNRFVQNHGIDKVVEMLVSWEQDNLSLNIDYDYYLKKTKNTVDQ